MWGLEPQSKGPTEPMCDPSPGLEHMLRTAQQFLVACAEYCKRGAHINLHGKRLREALGKQLTADSSGCEQGWQKPSHFCRPGKDVTDDEPPADDEQMKPLWEVNPDGNPLVTPGPPPPKRHDEAQKVIPSPCSPEELGSEMTWQEVVSLLEDQASLPGEGSHPSKLHRSPRGGDGGGLPGLGLVQDGPACPRARRGCHRESHPTGKGGDNL